MSHIRSAHFTGFFAATVYENLTPVETCSFEIFRNCLHTLKTHVICGAKAPAPSGPFYPSTA
jgi:hypothetical protein